MKNYSLLILLIITSLQAQTTFSQTSGTQLDYITSHLNELKDENRNVIYANSIQSDTIIITGEGVGNGFGISVSSAGDVNGDGYCDVIVGASYYNNSRGRAYIFFGGANMNNFADVTMTGEGSSDYFGGSVSTAGDVNGDGYSDIIVGASTYNINRGRAYIYFGGANMNSTADVKMDGGLPAINFGASVSTAGDVNGDGYSDVIVGTYDNSSTIGRAYIFWGGAIMNNSPDIMMSGEAIDTRFGSKVSFAGDVNGDGRSDVIVGAPNYNISKGRAYIFYSGSNVASVVMTGEASNSFFGSSVSTASDVNGDGFSDVIIGTESINGRAYIFYGGAVMNNVADVTMTGEGANNEFGISVSEGGDLNGDGYSDVIVGEEGIGSEAGSAYIFYGGINMNNVADITITLGLPTIYFGHSVSKAGDVNGDGYSDIVVGAMGYNNFTGRTYVYVNLIPRIQLINPSNNSINNPSTINFSWEKLNTTLYYVLHVSTDSTFNNTILNDTIITDTSRTISGFQRDTKYFWRVTNKDTSGAIYYSPIWNFKVIPPLKINLEVLIEGMYFPLFHQMSRRDTVKLYLRQSSPPYNKIDSAKTTIDSITFSGLFQFINASSGNYYIVLKHFNYIETWSKVGGEALVTDGSFYNYDFTTSASQAYGSNLKLKGDKYCMYSGDVNQSGFIDLSDFSIIDNDVFNFVEGRFVPSDLNGDTFVDQTDMEIGDNNRFYIGVIRP